MQRTGAFAWWPS